MGEATMSGGEGREGVEEGIELKGVATLVAVEV